MLNRTFGCIRVVMHAGQLRLAKTVGVRPAVKQELWPVTAGISALHGGE
jgi:hypothetical protein